MCRATGRDPDVEAPIPSPDILPGRNRDTSVERNLEMFENMVSFVFWGCYAVCDVRSYVYLFYGCIGIGMLLVCILYILEYKLLSPIIDISMYM